MPQQIYRRYPADQIDPGWTVVEPPYGTPYDRAAVTFNEATRTITITLQSDEAPAEPLYYIMSPYGPCGNSASWWAVDAHGYTSDLNKAWKVTRAQADRILNDKRGDRAYLVSEIDPHVQRHFDIQGLRSYNIRPADTESA